MRLYFMQCDYNIPAFDILWCKTPQPVSVAFPVSRYIHITAQSFANFWKYSHSTSTQLIVLTLIIKCTGGKSYYYPTNSCTNLYMRSWTKHILRYRMKWTVFTIAQVLQIHMQVGTTSYRSKIVMAYLMNYWWRWVIKVQPDGNVN